MEKLAIIGSGISALGAAYYLRDEFDVQIFEADTRVGGHTNTVVVDDGGSPLPIDTGFIVYNEVTYPNLTRLFAELKVPTHASDMSFGLHNQDTGLQFSGQTVSTLFAQRKNLFKPGHWRLLAQAARFNATAPVHAAADQANAPLREYLQENGYDRHFVYNYIVPMGSAVWSTPPGEMLEFPAATLIRFFANHGFLGMNTQLQWRTVSGGSQTYVERILAHLPGRVRTRTPVLGVRREGAGVQLRTPGGTEHFDRALVATHADQALRLLEDATARERQLLGAFAYTKNRAILHSDEDVLPPLRRVWSSWNYKARGTGPGGMQTATVYWMNRLQKLPTKRNYFVSINDYEDIDPARIHYQIDYEHPLFDSRAIEYQAQLPELNAGGPLYFAGSYFRYGFHEDGLLSGLKVVQNLLSREREFRVLAV